VVKNRNEYLLYEAYWLAGSRNFFGTKTKNCDNIMHISDSPENAEKEIKIWFDEDELVG